VDEKTGFDEVTWEKVMNIAVEAKRIIKEYKPFTIQLKRLNNFSSVVCVEGYDGGVIRDINEKLRDIDGVNTLPHDPSFLSHMSIAQFQSDQDYEGLIKTLEEKRETCIGKLIIDHIELVVAHLPKNNRYP
jgi:2'-5' RNA ligase